jgi:hypothetical protein
LKTGVVDFSIVGYTVRYNTGRYSNEQDNLYIVGKIEVDKNYPHTYYHKESLVEKFTDLFIAQDVDFKGKRKFSRSFHVLCDDAPRLQALWKGKDLDLLAKFKNMELEIAQGECFFRNSRKSFSVEEAKEFTELAKTLGDLFL